jgi:hypothetical protein
LVSYDAKALACDSEASMEALRSSAGLGVNPEQLQVRTNRVVISLQAVWKVAENLLQSRTRASVPIRPPALTNAHTERFTN